MSYLNYTESFWKLSNFLRIRAKQATPATAPRPPTFLAVFPTALSIKCTQSYRILLFLWSLTSLARLQANHFISTSGIDQHYDNFIWSRLSFLRLFYALFVAGASSPRRVFCWVRCGGHVNGFESGEEKIRTDKTLWDEIPSLWLPLVSLCHVLFI